MDISLRVAGEAGQGIQTIGEMLVNTFAHMGFYVFSHQDYMSRVRGGNNFYQIRTSDQYIRSSQKMVDLLLALNSESIELHTPSLNPTGMLLYDNTDFKGLPKEGALGIPISMMARDAGGHIYGNVVATGAMLGMLGFELAALQEVIRRSFSKKGAMAVEGNLKAALLGYEYAKRECLTCSFQIERPSFKAKRLMGGNQAIGIGAAVSGVRFYSAYPMTPSTGIMNFLASVAGELGIIVEQAEDEISAINMALGASYGGVRAMTGSSGGGFALMVEAVSLAAMTETPIVIAEVQRPGPATGLPTRTEQGDLLFVIFSGHGEFPKICFAPGSPEQAIRLTNKAFDLAERFQVPAFIISDQYLADSIWTVQSIDEGSLVYNDYRLKSQEMDYKRHAFTQDGISPFVVPGSSEALVVTDSDEHDESGHITESSEIRRKMVEKRLLKKLPLIRKEMKGPYYYGPKGPKLVLLGWGSTLGVLMDASDFLNKRVPTGVLHFSEIWPFPEGRELEILNSIKQAEIISVENNATGQFAWLLKAELGFQVSHKILKFDGRPFYSDELSEEVLKHARGL